MEEDREAADLLLALLEAWARHRSLALASAIASVGERTATRHPPLLDAESWHTLANRCDPLSVAALLRNPPPLHRPGVLRKRLRILARFPPDPRLCSFAQNILTALGASERPGNSELVSEAWTLHGRHASDPRAEARTADAPLLAAAAALGPGIEAELLAAIVSEPDSDGPRLVYADFLIERGDPRGEAIQIALRPGATPHISPSDRARWCQPLGPVDPNNVLFRRGFPDRLTLDGRRVPPPTVAWGTLRELHLPDPGLGTLPWVPGLLKLPNLRALRVPAPGVPDRAASWLAGAIPTLSRLPVEELCVPLSAWQPAHGDYENSETKLFPNLSRLGLYLGRDEIPDRLDALTLGGISARLQEIVLLSWGRTTPEHLRHALTTPVAPGIGRVTFASDSWPERLFGSPRLVLERGRDRVFSKLLLPDLIEGDEPHLAAILEGAPPGAFSEIVVATLTPAGARDQARIRALMGRFRSAKLLFSNPSR